MSQASPGDVKITLRKNTGRTEKHNCCRPASLADKLLTKEVTHVVGIQATDLLSRARERTLPLAPNQRPLVVGLTDYYVV